MKPALVTVGAFLMWTAVGHAQAAPDAEEIVGKLQADWLISAATLEGAKEELKDVNGRALEITIRGDRVTAVDWRGMKMEATYKLVGGPGPAQVDFTPDEGGGIFPGIFELNGDTLRVAVSREPGRRPKEFTSTAGSGVAVFVFQRVIVGGQAAKAVLKESKVAVVLGELLELQAIELGLGRFAKKEIDADQLRALGRGVLDKASGKDAARRDGLQLGAGLPDFGTQDTLVAALVPLGRHGTELVDSYSTALNEEIVQLARDSDIDPTAFKRGAALARLDALIRDCGSLQRLVDEPADVLLTVGVENHQRLKKSLAKDRSFLLGESALLLTRAAQEQKLWGRAEAYAAEAFVTFKRPDFYSHESAARALIELANVARGMKDTDGEKQYTEAARQHLAALLRYRERALGKEHPLSKSLRSRVDGLGGTRDAPAPATTVEPKVKTPPADDAAALVKRGEALEKTDPRGATALYKQAAQMGDGHAQMLYGLCLFDGEGVPRDRDGALTWLRKAAVNPNLPGDLVPVARFNIQRVLDDPD